MSLLQMSFSGAIFIIAVVIIRAMAINKLPKKTFLVLWEMVLLRLLIPFSVPYMFSVYTLIRNNTSTHTFSGTETGNMIPVMPQQNQVIATQGAEQLSQNTLSSVSFWFVVWCAGMIFFAVFFAISYLRCLREFQTSLPVHNEYVEQWLKERPLKRQILVRQSDRISAPLTYGVIHPVILMPKKTDWENVKQLQYVLSHEYVHIYRFDTITKLIATLALCIHWFNPVVWVMHILFNRDIELACDESVIRQFGENSKSAYARMLIDMEMKKGGLMPFCNSFSKNAIEERITAIMKIKKTSMLAICIAAILIVGVTTTFATSAAGSSREKDIIHSTNFSDEEIDKLFALQFDGYKDMSVSEFQNKVWKLTDTSEYLNLLEKFSQDTTLYEQKDSNEVASFLFYTLEPLTAEKWQTRDFGGGITTDYSSVYDNAMLEYIISLTIQNADTLTVGEYNAARLGVSNGLQNILQGKTKEQLQDDSYMQEAIRAEIEKLNEQWNTDKLQISVEYFFRPLSELNARKDEQENILQGQEHREYPSGTEEDYHSLLKLKTADYQSKSVADFNMDLLGWANENDEGMARITDDVVNQDFSVNLNNDELSFVTLTTWLSRVENGKYVQSKYMGQEEEDPSYNQYLPLKTTEKSAYGDAWCDLYYQFSYHIADKQTLTVGERDDRIGNMISEIQDFWNKTDIEEMLNMSKDDIVRKLQGIAAKYSNANIIITIRDDSVNFEKLDERNREFN